MILVVAVLARVPPLLAAGVMTACFVVAWVRWASADSSDGLWVVGAAMLVVGMTAATVAVAFLVDGLRRLAQDRGRRVEAAQ